MNESSIKRNWSLNRLLLERDAYLSMLKSGEITSVDLDELDEIEVIIDRKRQARKRLIPEETTP